MELESEEDGKKVKLKTGTPYIIIVSTVLFAAGAIFVYRAELAAFAAAILAEPEAVEVIIEAPE